MAEESKPNPNCGRCGGTNKFEEWAELPNGNWLIVTTTCGCGD
jgi:rubredoxin